MATLTMKQKKQKVVKIYGDARDNADHRGPKSTMPPRSRDGMSFPGGKLLRKAFERLSRRQNDYNNLKKKDGFTKPGSMKA